MVQREPGLHLNLEDELGNKHLLHSTSLGGIKSPELKVSWIEAKVWHPIAGLESLQISQKAISAGVSSMSVEA